MTRKPTALNSASPPAKHSIPPNLASHCWQPGQSGNPGGFNGAHGEALRLAREASPKAVLRLIELMGSDDARVAVVACNAILDRGLGKPREIVPQLPNTESPEAMAHKQEAREFMIAALDAKAAGKW
jgi:hypothetical protein